MPDVPAGTPRPLGDDQEGSTPIAKLRSVTAADTHKRDSGNVWLRTAIKDPQYRTFASFVIPSFKQNVRFAELMEVQRQAGIISVHQHLGVPRDDAFILGTIQLSIDRPRLLSSAKSRRGTVKVEVSRIARSQTRIRAAVQSFTMRTQSGIAAHGSINATFVPNAAYERLRRHAAENHPGESVTPQFHSSMRSEHLIVDPADPIVSDHDTDHVSAMTVACGIEKSMTRAQTGPRLRSLTLSFVSFVERAPTPTLEFQFGEVGAFSGFLNQAGTIRATFTGRTSGGEDRQE